MPILSVAKNPREAGFCIGLSTLGFSRSFAHCSLAQNDTGVVILNAMKNLGEAGLLIESLPFPSLRFSRSPAQGGLAQNYNPSILGAHPPSVVK